LSAISAFSVSHFKRNFKADTGDTPWNYIMELKIKKTKVLLSNPNPSITQCAFDLGFSSSSYFTVVFKHFTKVTPREFIKSLPMKNL
jgi:AraC family transcriptional regulator